MIQTLPRLAGAAIAAAAPDARASTGIDDRIPSIFGTVGLGRGLAVFYAACIVGIADAMLLLMSIPNLIGVYLLMPVVKRELDSYLARLRSGEIRPRVRTLE